MGKIKWTVVLSVLMIILLAGCNKEEKAGPTETTIGISKKGTITVVEVQPFQKDFYNQDEVLALAEKEAAAFNSVSGENGVSVKEFTAENNVAKMKTEYKDYKAYEGYTGEEIFAGTVEQANEAGINLDLLLLDIEANKKISKTDILVLGKHMIVVLNEPIAVNTSGKITHVSDNVEVTGKRTAKVTGTDAPAYIIFKK